MIRRIVLLERVGLPSIDRTWRVAFRLTVPEPRRRFHVNPTATSAHIDASAEEVSALQSGEIVEVVDTLTAPQGVTDEQALAMLEGSHARRQAEIDARNAWSNYGTSWDGTTWTRLEIA